MLPRGEYKLFSFEFRRKKQCPAGKLVEVLVDGAEDIILTQLHKLILVFGGMDNRSDSGLEHFFTDDLFTRKLDVSIVKLLQFTGKC